MTKMVVFVYLQCNEKKKKRRGNTEARISHDIPSEKY